MPLIWARSDPEFRLTHGKLFETAYPRKYLPHVTDAQKQSMNQNDVYKITSNVFEHPSLDLDSIFQYSRLTGLVSIEDKVSIQLFLKECQDDIKLLDTKIRDNISTIARLSCDLAQASARMVQKVSQVRLCEYLLSSPQNLPQDILEEIFLACLAAGEDLYPGQTCPSLQLSAVCHRWRTIALSMPTLWNGLHLSSPTVHQIKSAESWASRCYLPTLTLEFDKANYSTRSSVRLREFLDTLRGPSRSLRKIDVIGLEGTLGEVIKEFLVEPEQLALEELVHRDSSKGLPSLPKSLPNLRRIYAQTPPLDWHQFPPPSQLTVLWLTSKVQCTMLVNILVNCHDLESLYIRIGEDGLQYSLESLISKDITVPKLKCLGLWDEYRAEEPPVDLLQRITFPSLRVVEYSVSQRRQDSLLWLGFIHALHSVRRLTFQFHDLLPPIDTFAHLLGHASSISELLISTTAPCMPSMITSLSSLPTRLVNQSPVLPNLRTLLLNIGPDPLTKWLSFQPQLSDFGSAWTVTTPQSSGPQAEGRGSLTELVIQHRYNGTVDAKDRNKTWQCPEVREMFRTTCPNLRVRMVCIDSVSWLWPLPMSFEMFPLPFNDAYVHGVLNEDDTWTDQRQPVHRIMS